MLSNNQNQPKCLKCGMPINEPTCPNCGQEHDFLKIGNEYYEASNYKEAYKWLKIIHFQ